MPDEAVENVEATLQNIFGVVSAGKQYKKYVRRVAGKQYLNRISCVSLN